MGRLFSVVSRFVSQDLNMRYVAAALLAALGGGEPSAANIKKILSSVGIDADDEKVKMVADELAGKNIEELIEKARASLAACQLVELLQLQLLPQLLEELLPQLLPRWRKKRRRKMTTWVLVFSIRTFPLQQLHHHLNQHVQRCYEDL